MFKQRSSFLLESWQEDSPVRIDSKFRHAIYDSTKKNGRLVNLYDNIPFIFKYFLTYDTPSSTEKYCENTEPKSCQTAKYVFFTSSSDGLAQICVTLSRWFLHKTATIYSEQVQTSHFYQRRHFQKLVCMCTNHLTMKELLFKFAEFEIRLCACMKTGSDKRKRNKMQGQQITKKQGNKVGMIA